MPEVKEKFFSGKKNEILNFLISTGTLLQIMRVKFLRVLWLKRRTMKNAQRH
jgi:hypothetical protein